MSDTSIWRSLETTAVSMGFDYSDYVQLHTDAKCIGAVLSRDQYTLIDLCFNVGLLEANQNYCAKCAEVEELY